MLKEILAAFRLWFCNNIIGNIPISIIRKLYYKFVMGFKIAPGASILTQCRFAKGGGLSLGRNTIVNNRCIIDNRYSIEIGDNVSISIGCKIYTAGHDINSDDFKMMGSPVKIEDYVWLCADSIIQPGVIIGRGAVVLPGSVATKDIGTMSVVGGNPCRLIQMRTSGLSYTLNWNPLVPAFG